MTDKVLVYKDSRGEWRWTRKAGNNETISDSGEGYLHKEHAVEMAHRANENCEVEVADGRA